MVSRSLYALAFFYTLQTVSVMGADHSPSHFEEVSRRLKQNVTWCLNKVRTLGQFITPRENGIHFPYEKGWGAKTGRALQDGLKLLEVILTPLPAYLISTPTDRIFAKLWKSPQTYEPTADEWQVLERYRLVEAFHRKKAFMKAWPRWVKVQRGFVATRRILLTASLLFGINHALQAGTPITRDQYLKDSRWELGPHQIQLINESVPFPHTAIRMGGKVYSYGYTHLTVKPVNEYLMNKSEFAQRFQRQAAQAHATSSAAVTGWLARQLSKLERTVQVVTLNLTEEEYASLKRDLELSTGNRYHNVTCVHDCTTMVMENLSENTGIATSRFFDASPSQTFFYFSVLETLGSSRVDDIFQVEIDSPQGKWTHAGRNWFITTMESKFFIDLLIYDQPRRDWMHWTKSPEQLEWREPAVQKEIESWTRAVEEEILSDPQMIAFDALVARRAKLSGSDRRDLIAQMKKYFEDQIGKQEAIETSYQSDFKDLIFAGIRIHYYREKLRDYLHLLTE